MPDKHILQDTSENVRYITLNKPDQLNAFDLPMLIDLTRAVQRAAFDPAIRAVVITGAGRAFCAGGDLNYVNRLRQERDEVGLAEFSNRTEELMTEIALAPKPVITAVQGLAYAGGLIMVLMADITIASTSASFCAIQAKRGLLDPYVVGPLISRVGTERAKRLVYTSAIVDASAAKDIGLISEVVDDEKLPARVTEVAGELTAMPAGTLRVFKQMFAEIAPRYQLPAYRAHLATEEARDGVAAFVGEPARNLTR
jgi:methylglutaconyl-CoA hydratase